MGFCGLLIRCILGWGAAHMRVYIYHVKHAHIRNVRPVHAPFWPRGPYPPPISTRPPQTPFSYLFPKPLPQIALFPLNPYPKSHKFT